MDCDRCLKNICQFSLEGKICKDCYRNDNSFNAFFGEIERLDVDVKIKESRDMIGRKKYNVLVRSKL